MSTLKTNAIQTVAGQPLLNSTGSIIQVVYGDMGANVTQIAAQNNTVVNNISVTITPTRSTSKILLQAHMVHDGWYVNSWGFARNGSNIGGNTNTNSSNAISTNYMGHDSVNDRGWCLETTYYYLDSPGTTSAITYAPTACSSWAGTIYTLTINDRRDANMRSLSSIVAMEILA